MSMETGSILWVQLPSKVLPVRVAYKSGLQGMQPLMSAMSRRYLFFCHEFRGAVSAMSHKDLGKLEALVQRTHFLQSVC